MDKKFYIEIKPDFYYELGEDFGNGNLLYIPWGDMEIIINNEKFFEVLDRHPEWKLGTGFCMPLYTCIEQLIELPYKLRNEVKELYTDPENQIIGAIIFERKDENIIVAMIDDNDWYEQKDKWYDGEKVVYSEPKEVPVSKYNVVSYEDFKKGCKKSVNDIMKLLEERYKEIKYASGFINLKKLIKKYEKLGY